MNDYTKFTKEVRSFLKALERCYECSEEDHKAFEKIFSILDMYIGMIERTSSIANLKEEK